MRAIASTLPIGKMALKIAVAATISFIIAQALRGEYPFYAVIAAIIVMGSTAGSTLNLGIQRLISGWLGRKLYFLRYSCHWFHSRCTGRIEKLLVSVAFQFCSLVTARWD